MPPRWHRLTFRQHACPGGQKCEEPDRKDHLCLGVLRAQTPGGKTVTESRRRKEGSEGRVQDQETEGKKLLDAGIE